jgi:hypothetical protein
MTCLYSPLKLIILLHYHTTPRAYAENEPDHANSPAVRECVSELLEEDMIHEVCGDRFTTTDRGRFFIDYLMTIPFPAKKWAIELPTRELDNA